jgi:hypothetical protein
MTTDKTNRQQALDFLDRARGNANEIEGSEIEVTFCLAAAILFALFDIANAIRVEMEKR